MGRSKNDSKREAVGKHQSGSSPTTSSSSSTEQQTIRVSKHRAHAPSKGRQRQESPTLPTTSGDDLRQSFSPPTTQPSLGAERKSKLRLRNREAAQKCRKRKLRGIEDLQSQEVAVEAIHNSLLAEASQLQNEVLMLKSMVLDHGGCDCAFIEEYIQGAASNLVNQEDWSGRVNFTSVDDGNLLPSVVKTEDGAPEAGYLGAEGYPQASGEGNQLGLQQQYESAKGSGSVGIDMAVSPLALQANPAQSLGLRL